MTLVDDKEDFAQKFHSGTEIRKILDRDKETNDGRILEATSN